MSNRNRTAELERRVRVLEAENRGLRAELKAAKLPRLLLCYSHTAAAISGGGTADPLAPDRSATDMPTRFGATARW